MTVTAKLAYLTTPAPDRFVLNIQIGGDFIQYEISKAHLANILIDGTALVLRDSGRLSAKLNPANEALSC